MLSLLFNQQPPSASQLAVSGIASAEAFGTLTLTVGGVSFQLTGIPSAETFGSPIWAAAALLSQSGIPSAEAFGSLTWTTAAALSLSGIASGEAFGSPIWTPGSVPIALSGIPTAEAFGSIDLSGGGNVGLVLTGIPSAETFGTLSWTTAAALTLSGITTAEAFGIPTFLGNASVRTTIFPNGQVLTSMAITPQALNTLLQTLTCNMLGIDPAVDPLAYSKVRLEWPQQGQPGFGIADDVCFLRVVEEDDPYNRIRDRQYGPQGSGFGSTDTYTRVWRVSWCLYGPNSFDNARLIKSALFSADFAHDTLAAQSLFLVSDVPATRRNPEKYQNQWWDRSDLDVRLNELVTETLTMNSITSAEILVFNGQGIQVEDIQASE